MQAQTQIIDEHLERGSDFPNSENEQTHLAFYPRTFLAMCT